MKRKNTLLNIGFQKIVALSLIMLLFLSSCGSSYSVRQIRERKKAEQFGAYPMNGNKKK